MVSVYLSPKAIDLCLNPGNRSGSLPLPSGLGILLHIREGPWKDMLFYMVPEWNPIISCMPVPQREYSLSLLP